MPQKEQQLSVNSFSLVSRINLFLIAGRACPKISVFFATVTPDEGVFEDVIEVNCFSGYQFEDTSVKKLLTCQSNGAWSASLTTCVRE